MKYNPDLPRHAADKASRAVRDVLCLTDDLDEKLHIALMACTAPIGMAAGVLAAKIERQGTPCTEAQAYSVVFDLLKTLAESGPQAVIDSLDRATGFKVAR